MRHYISTLHKRSHSHKKRFALLTSAGFTLMIFAIWTLVNFGGADATEASANRAVSQANPFGSLLRGIGTGFSSLWGGVSELKEGLEVVDIESGYEEMKRNTLNNYGE